MSLFTVGRLCVKIAGRDAGRKCVVVDVLDNNLVLIDGNTRRKKVNIKHLEPLSEVIELKDKASHDLVRAAFQKLSLPTWEKKSKNVPSRVKRQKKAKVKPEPKKKAAKKTDSKKTAEKPAEKKVEQKAEEKPKSEVKEEKK